MAGSLESAIEAALSTSVVEKLVARNRGKLPEAVGPGGRYRLLDLVGGGSSGSVYRAVDTRYSDEHHEEIVAVKLLREEESADEARKARYMRHENVVRSLDFGEGFVVFQFVAGGSLADARRPMDADGAASLIARIADGVQAAHGQGLVHRDLKPANVLLDEDGTPKVADFGIALRDKEIEAMGAAGAAGRGARPTGNRAFMAPELFSEGRSAISTQVDVYALGAMLYWLLTDRLPHGQSFEEIERSQLEKRRAELTGVPRDLASICGRAMDPDPAGRYDSAAQLAADLRRYAARRPIEWMRPGLRRRAALLWRRDRRLAVVGLTAVTILVCSSAGVGWFFAEYREAKKLDEQKALEAQQAGDALAGMAYLLGVLTKQEDAGADSSSPDSPEPGAASQTLGDSSVEGDSK